MDLAHFARMSGFGWNYTIRTQCELAQAIVKDALLGCNGRSRGEIAFEVAIWFVSTVRCLSFPFDSAHLARAHTAAFHCFREMRSCPFHSLLALRYHMLLLPMNGPSFSTVLSRAYIYMQGLQSNLSTLHQPERPSSAYTKTSLDILLAYPPDNNEQSHTSFLL